jgi:hypothetical protein
MHSHEDHHVIYFLPKEYQIFIIAISTVQGIVYWINITYLSCIVWNRYVSLVYWAMWLNMFGLRGASACPQPVRPSTLFTAQTGSQYTSGIHLLTGREGTCYTSSFPEWPRSRPINWYHFQAFIIWSDGPFNFNYFFTKIYNLWLDIANEVDTVQNLYFNNRRNKKKYRKKNIIFQLSAL